MKRLTQLAQKERSQYLSGVSLVDAAEKGFWQCKRCNLPVAVEERTDFQDDSRIYHVCAKCGSVNVRYHDPVAQVRRAESGVRKSQPERKPTKSQASAHEWFEQMRQVNAAAPDFSPVK